MVTRARIEHRTALLAEDFGEHFARRRFGDAIVDALPRIARGKRKGRIAGMVQWKKCTSGGWSNKPSRSGVVRPGVFDVTLTDAQDRFRYADPSSWMTEDISARWRELGKPFYPWDVKIIDVDEAWGTAADRRAVIAKERAEIEAAE